MLGVRRSGRRREQEEAKRHLQEMERQQHRKQLEQLEKHVSKEQRVAPYSAISL